MFSSIIERFNEKRDGAREAGVDAGFTLIELMVVLLIMAILLAIAIPTFLGVSGSANDRAAQSNLNTALTNAKSYYQNSQQSYTGVTLGSLVGSLNSQEPSLSWVTGSSTTSGTISVDVATDGNGIQMAALSKNGNCWFVVSNEQLETASSEANVPAAQLQAGTWYGVIPSISTTKYTCTADSAADATSWSSSGNSAFPSA